MWKRLTGIEVRRSHDISEEGTEGAIVYRNPDDEEWLRQIEKEKKDQEKREKEKKEETRISGKRMNLNLTTDDDSEYAEIGGFTNPGFSNTGDLYDEAANAVNGGGLEVGGGASGAGSAGINLGGGGGLDLGGGASGGDGKKDLSGGIDLGKIDLGGTGAGTGTGIDFDGDKKKNNAGGGGSGDATIDLDTGLYDSVIDTDDSKKIGAKLGGGAGLNLAGAGPKNGDVKFNVGGPGPKVGLDGAEKPKLDLNQNVYDDGGDAIIDADADFGINDPGVKKLHPDDEGADWPGGDFWAGSKSIDHDDWMSSMKQQPRDKVKPCAVASSLPSGVSVKSKNLMEIQDPVIEGKKLVSGVPEGMFTYVHVEDQSPRLATSGQLESGRAGGGGGARRSGYCCANLDSGLNNKWFWFFLVALLVAVIIIIAVVVGIRGSQDT